MSKRITNLHIEKLKGLENLKSLCEASHKLFRDAKQFCGLTDSQVRDSNKLDCAFNASFASLNVAKVMMKERQMEYSMSNFKLLMTNTFLTKRIFDVSRYRPNQTLINHIFKDLFGCTA